MESPSGADSSTSITDSASDAKIRSGKTVLLKIPKGDIRCATVDQDSIITLGRQGSFYASELIGQPYGQTYEIVDKRLNPIAPPAFQEVEDTDATNEMINDSQSVQPLGLEEIEELKRSGVHASDIIKKQIEHHANFALKTEYSKEKYKKRKENKYSKSFTTLEPTVFNVCEYWFKKDQARIRDIRVDTLAQMMNLANIRPGGRYIAVDDASGMVVAAMLHRMGGEGQLITVCDIDGPPAYPVMGIMNMDKATVTSVLTSLNWSTIQEDYAPILAPSDPPLEEIKSEKHRIRLSKRKMATDTLMRTRNELFAGEFEALVVSSEFDPLSILETLSPYLAGSASIVVQSPHVQILANLQSKLRVLPQYLAPNLTEAWLRRYQVLPGRTHPLMNMSGSGGYLLHTIKVYDDPSASSAMLRRQPKNKRQKTPADSEPPTLSVESTGGKRSAPGTPPMEQMTGSTEKDPDTLDLL